MPENTYAGGDANYETVDTLRNADGMCTVITRKRATGALSVSLSKEFERGGQTDRSAFFARRQIEGAIELLKLTADRMDQITDQDRASTRVATEAKQKARRTANSRRS